MANLGGKIDPKSYGDRIAKGRPLERDDTVSDRQSKRHCIRDDDVVYQPKTKETRDAYEAMLGLIQQHLGGLTLNIKLLKPIPEEMNQVFDQLVSFGKLITDFGVAVEFEEDEEDSDSDIAHDEELQETGDMQVVAGEGTSLNVQDIDTYWLHRETSIEREENLLKSLYEAARRLKDRTVADGDLESGWFKGQRQMLDLESLAFVQGGLLMANTTCVLPPGFYRSRGEGYDELNVPWVSKKVDINEKLVKITEMPAWAQPAFKGMQQLNSVQSKVYETALFKDDNILLCAPTGAGKTNVAMLTILQQIGFNKKDDGTYNHGNYKIVYVTPMKALVTEVVSNLSYRLKDYGVTVKELSGDQSLSGKEIEEAQIIVTTPEKWDIITRKSSDTQLVRLVIIDEIHLLHDNRGPVLESIVARTLRQIETTKENIRLVGLSATLPNYEDVALFLRVDLKKGLFKFDRSYRPVPLGQQYIGISVKEPLQKFQMMNDLCYQKVVAGAGKHQVLIFVHSRNETAKTAKAILETAMANDTLSRFLKEDSASREVLQSQIELIKNGDLKKLLPYGFAIHHAGLARGDREIVEALFGEGHVQVLVSTETLAWSVKLHAHTVIIKGTEVYNPEKGAWMELTPLDVMQMLGHAGRPQYDQYGEVTDLGRIASYNCVSHGTIATYNEHLKPTMGDIDLYHLLSLSEEFKYVTVGPDEKMELTKLLDRVTVPIKETLEEPSAKINVLLQAYISQLKLESLSLTSDMVFIGQNAGRLVRALYEIVLKRGWVQLSEKALKMRIGVVGAITSWNFPLAMITRKVGPALASGCTVVIKPSQLMPLTALAAAEFALQAGAPVRYDFRLEPLTILIDCFVSFDGSCCIYCKKVSLELGGNPSIIFDDADLDVAVKATLSDSHENSGQTCVCANRVLVVQRTPLWILHLVSISIFFSTGIYDKFAEAFSEAVQKLEVGDGFKEGTPRSTYKRCINSKESFVQDAVSNRAKIILGGKRHSLGMTFYEALLLSLIIVLRICFLGRRFSDQKLSESLMTLLQDLLLIYSQTVSNDRGVSLKHLSAGL
ncbi:BnaC02g25790D [Brassica napus]|uniref:RNA helicase n=2 Tax=Brassica napus TaxID=3708 RepID=A0A078G729_BRANA|nr:BnaC02g25790D [Brassica napus]